MIIFCTSVKSFSSFTPKNSQYIQIERTKKTDGYNNGKSIPMTMGLEIKIRIVGRKNGCEQWLQDSYEMYTKRLRSSNIDVETIWHKNNAELEKGVKADTDKSHSIVLLDPSGKTKTSEEFSDEIYRWFDEGGSRLAFVIGGAEGLPPALKYGQNRESKGNDNTSIAGSNMLSLSTMTFTHQLARTVLIEQIYRAAEIKKGSGYHK